VDVGTGERTLERTREHARPRRLAAGAIGALIVLGLAPSARATDKPGPCPLVKDADTSVRAHSRDLIRCAVKHWPVPGGAATAICIAKRESGLNPKAESSDGLNKGLFQQHVDYWDGNYDRYTRTFWELRHSILNGRTNAIVSIRMAHAGGWGPWGGRRCG
jgi:hypothetical protein